MTTPATGFKTKTNKRTPATTPLYDLPGLAKTLGLWVGWRPPPKEASIPP